MTQSVLILWADSRSANLGVRVLAEGASAIARRAWPDAEVVLQDFAPNASGFSPMSTSTVLREFGAKEITKWIREFDIVLDTGAGDSFTDIYGLRRFATLSLAQRRAMKSDSPFIMLPQTIGPFRTVAGRHIASRTLKQADRVYARDSKSLVYAKAAGASNLHPSTDLVFALPALSSEKRWDILLNISGLLWESSAHGNRERYRSSIRQLLVGLRERGRSVTLLAHVLNNRTLDSDVDVVQSVGDEFGLQALIPETLEDAREHIAASELVIGSRMHACLNALSQSVPAIAWAYSRKFAPLLNDLGWRHVIDLATEPNPAAATLRVLGEPSLRSSATATALSGRKAVESLYGTLESL